MDNPQPFVNLKDGNTVGVIALSAPVQRERLQRGIEHLESQGFATKVVLDPSAHYSDNKYLFSSDAAEKRSQALLQLYQDPSVAAIICARGAYGSMECLPYIDFQKLSKYPKPLIGFSDATAVLNSCVQKAGLLAIHGPTIESAFSKAADSVEAKESAQALVALLRGTVTNPFSQTSLTKLCGEERAVEGRIVGGNLSMIAALVGTPWEVDLAAKILFIEETGEKPYRIHRMLMQLRLSSTLKQVGAVILGSFTNCVHAQGLGPTLEDVLINIFAESGIPVVREISSGHSPRNLPLVLGINARLTANKLEFIESPVLS